MGEDDDWLLNPMIFDDLNVREKLAMDFWNTYIYPKSSPYQMSCGEYIELFVDNEYRGLYLLQRRIDEEYLPIDRDRDIIFKGYSNLTEFAKVPTDYEIIYSPFDQEKTYELLIDALNFENGHSIDLDSFVNIELYLNYLHAIDNRRFKNTFFILRAEESGYVLYFLPWDTDLSLGIAWTDTAILSNLDMTLNRTGHRVEYTVLTESFPGLEQDIARQWQQMRGQIYQADKFIKIFEENRSVLEGSGAPIRDEQKWGLFHSGTDTQEQMLTFINERLEVLDLHYQAVLEK